MTRDGILRKTVTAGAVAACRDPSLQSALDPLRELHSRLVAALAAGPVCGRSSDAQAHQHRS